MRKILIIFICCFSLHIKAQEASLAFLYFRNGEYEKAVSIYKVLHEKTLEEVGLWPRGATL